MGCFLSFICGFSESERRSQARQRESLNSVNNTNINFNSEEILIYSPDTGNYGNFKPIEDKQHLGVPLKRIKFKWKLSEDMSIEDLNERRKSFWETCYTIGVRVLRNDLFEFNNYRDKPKFGMR